MTEIGDPKRCSAFSLAALLVTASPAAWTAPVSDGEGLEIATTPQGAMESLTDTRLDMTVPVPAPGRNRIEAAATTAQAERLILQLRNIHLVSRPGLYYEVYLNLPAGLTPDADSVYYVGNLTFFGRHDHIDPATQQRIGFEQHFDITDAANALKAASAWDSSKLRISLVPRGLEAPGSQPQSTPGGLKATIGQVRLAIESAPL